MKLEEIYKKITSLEDYTPSKKVNFLFSELVSKAVDPLNEEVLSKKECSCLQKICSHAEYEMEKYWAREIIGGRKKVTDFPYYANYRDLTRLELNALVSCTYHKHHNVLFVGCGPLPMTAIILAINHNICSTLIDNDHDAVELAKSVLNTLNLQNMISVVWANGNSFSRYKKFNVIFVAALAGVNSRQKGSIFKHIKENALKHCHIIARSSWGKRKLLYPPLPRLVYSIFKPLIEISPYNEIVNSVVILKNDYK